MIASEQVHRRIGAHESRNLLQLGDALTLIVAVLSAGALDLAEPLFMLVLGLSGITARHLLAERPFRAKRLSSRTLLSPLLAASITLLILAAVREPYSGVRLLSFVLLWTFGMIAVRRLVWRYTPPARVLILGESGVYDDLLQSRDLELHRRQSPPDSILGWDFVAVDGISPVNTEWARWIAHADLAGVSIINAHTLSEEISGKIAVSSLVDRWAEEVFQGDSQYRVIKRVLDVSCVIVLSPILLLLTSVISLIVLVDSGRPILFVQNRVGLGGKPCQGTPSFPHVGDIHFPAG